MNKSKLETIRNEEYVSLNLTKEEKRKRRMQLKARLKELYPNLQTLTEQDYLRISVKYNAGDKSVVPELIDKSLQTIFTAVVYIYSSYDFSKLDFEDALQIAYAHAYDLITLNSNSLNKTKRQYEGVLHINTKLHLSREYQKMMRHNAHLAVDDYITDYVEEFDLDEINYSLNREDIISVIKNCYKTLSETEKVVFNMSFVEKKRDATISEATNKTVPTVRYIRSKIKAKMLEALENNGFGIDEFTNDVY